MPRKDESHWIEVEAGSPEAAAGQLAQGDWDDTNNELLHDRVGVYDPMTLLYDTGEN